MDGMFVDGAVDGSEMNVENVLGQELMDEAISPVPTSDPEAERAVAAAEGVPAPAPQAPPAPPEPVAPPAEEGKPPEGTPAPAVPPVPAEGEQHPKRISYKRHANEMAEKEAELARYKESHEGLQALGELARSNPALSIGEILNGQGAPAAAPAPNVDEFGMPVPAPAPARAAPMQDPRVSRMERELLQLRVSTAGSQLCARVKTETGKVLEPDEVDAVMACASDLGMQPTADALMVAYHHLDFGNRGAALESDGYTRGRKEMGEIDQRRGAVPPALTSGGPVVAAPPAEPQAPSVGKAIRDYWAGGAL